MAIALLRACLIGLNGLLVGFFTCQSSYAAQSGSCPQDGTPTERLEKAKEVLRRSKISFQTLPDGSIQITPAIDGPFLATYAQQIKIRYRAKVIVSPATFICGASALTDPSDLCNLKVNLGWQALFSPETQDTFPHEAKHLELAGPTTNAGYDSLFFGRISNLDHTDHSFYPSFALDEIAAYATSIPWLIERRSELSAQDFKSQLFSNIIQLNNLVPRAEKIVQRYRDFLKDLQRDARGYATVVSDENIVVANLTDSGKPALVLGHVDWRESGAVNTVILLDGRDQITIPLFRSALDVAKEKQTATIPTANTANAAKISPNIIKEISSIVARFDAMLSMLNQAKAAVGAMASVADEAVKSSSSPAATVLNQKADDLNRAIKRGEKFEQVRSATNKCGAKEEPINGKSIPSPAIK